MAAVVERKRVSPCVDGPPVVKENVKQEPKQCCVHVSGLFVLLRTGYETHL